MLTDRGQGTLLSTHCVPNEYENNLSFLKGLGRYSKLTPLTEYKFLNLDK